MSALTALARADARWILTLYPTAGEAGGCFVPSRRPRPVYVPGYRAADPERARVEAARRARGKVRRYCAANRLNRMGTLTYAGSGQHDPKQVRCDVAVFFRSLRAALGGRPLPYVWVPEWHKTDHGLHLHYAMGQYAGYRLIRDTWGHGNIWIHRHSDMPVGSTRLHEARRAAGYLSKYVTKSFNADASSRAAGLHRYDVAQGFQPAFKRFHGLSAQEVLSDATAEMRASPAQVWTSAEAEKWLAPPAVWCAWD